MVNIIAGLRGSGKTKKMIDLANESTGKESGVVVYIECGKKQRTFDLTHPVRLVDSTEYDIKGFQVLRGFITGMYSGNYDISHIFIDSLQKITNTPDMAETEKFVVWLDAFSNKYNVSFTVSIGQEEQTLTDKVKSFILK